MGHKKKLSFILLINQLDKEKKKEKTMKIFQHATHQRSAEREKRVNIYSGKYSAQ